MTKMTFILVIPKIHYVYISIDKNVTEFIENS